MSNRDYGDEQPETTQRVWSGGAYRDREGIEVTADGHGITIDPWYDGGISILQDEHGGKVRLSWDELDAMRKAAGV